MTFSWFVLSQPAGGDGSFDDPTSPSPAFTTSVEGEYALQVTVTASDGQADSATVDVLVWPAAEEGNYLHLVSDPGDRIGGGAVYRYGSADAQIVVMEAAGHLEIQVTGGEKWFGDFQLPSPMMSYDEIRTYDGVTRYPFHDAATGGLDWYGEGRACDTLAGWFAVDSVAYDGNTLVALDMRFGQRCEAAAAALHGEIHWNASDTNSPPGPLETPPRRWQPTPGETPASGDYVYLKSEGDWVGQLGTYLYTRADALLHAVPSDGLLQMGVQGDEYWNGFFQAMEGVTSLQPGYYGSLRWYDPLDTARGGISWSGEYRACEASGWFAVDDVSYADGALQRVDLRFEQRCWGYRAALHGKIHWTIDDPTVPPGPTYPPPSDLWTPPPGSTPSAGNYIYLESDPGDYILQGNTDLVTSFQWVSASGIDLHILAGGWSGDFQGVVTRPRLERGYYGTVKRYGFNNPVRGGLDWGGGGRGCNELTGWFVIDDVAYSGDALTAIDLRFEQHCENLPPALHGAVHWVSDGG